MMVVVTSTIAVYLYNATGVPRGLAALYTMTIVCVARFFGSDVGVVTAILSTVAFDTWFVKPTFGVPFRETHLQYFLIYFVWLIVGALGCRDLRIKWDEATPRSVTKVVDNPPLVSGAAQAASDLFRISETDSAFLLVWRVESLAGRQLTAAEIAYWTEVARRAAQLPTSEERLRLLSVVGDDDADDGDRDTAVIER